MFSGVSGRTDLLVMGAKPGAPRTLYRVGPGRPPAAVLTPEAAEYIDELIAVTPDGRSVAVGVRGTESCTTTVAVIRMPDGPAARHPAPAASVLRTLWSAPDGTIHATFASKLPGHADCLDESIGKPQAFRLERGRWVKGITSADGSYTRSGWGAVLAVTGQHRIGETPVPTGTLRLRRAATTMTIAEEVLAYAVSELTTQRDESSPCTCVSFRAGAAL